MGSQDTTGTPDVPASDGSGIKVLDRAVLILTTVASRPHSLAQLADATGLPRATAHRLASALETHGMLARDSSGHWTIGSTLLRLSSNGTDTLITTAMPLMSALKERTGESVQLYRLGDSARTCVASQEPTSGLRNTVPVGTRLPLTQGSAAKVFAAFAPEAVPPESFTEAELIDVRAHKIAESVGEREVGLASLSSPVLARDGSLVAVLSVSGAAARLGPHPIKVWGKELVDAAQELGSLL